MLNLEFGLSEINLWHVEALPWNDSFWRSEFVGGFSCHFIASIGHVRGWRGAHWAMSWKGKRLSPMPWPNGGERSRFASFMTKIRIYCESEVCEDWYYSHWLIFGLEKRAIRVLWEVNHIFKPFFILDFNFSHRFFVGFCRESSKLIVCRWRWIKEV